MKDLEEKVISIDKPKIKKKRGRPKKIVLDDEEITDKDIDV